MNIISGGDSMKLRHGLLAVVLLSIASIASAQIISTELFSIEGGDPGEGLSWHMPGSLYAINVGRPSGEIQTVQGLDFVGLHDNDNPHVIPGVTVSQMQFFMEGPGGWHWGGAMTDSAGVIDFGDSDNDDALEVILNSQGYKIDGDSRQVYQLEVVPWETYAIYVLYRNYETTSTGSNILLDGTAVDMPAGHNPGDGMHDDNGTKGIGVKIVYKTSGKTLELVSERIPGHHGVVPAIVVEVENRGQVSTTAPAKDAIDAPTDVTLEWTLGNDPETDAPWEGARKFALYLSDNPALGDNDVSVADPILLDIGTTSYQTALETDTTYYWIVDTIFNEADLGDSVNVWGMVQNFTTVSSVPVVVSVDAHGSALPGETTDEVAVTFDSLTVPTVTWLKGNVDVTGAADFTATLTADANTPTLYTATLTKANMTLADEGDYVAVVGNETTDGGKDSAQANVGLGLQRQVAQWSLNQEDFAGGMHANLLAADAPSATAVGETAFTSGADGAADGAIQIVASSGVGYAQAGTYNPSAYTGQFGVSTWINVTKFNNQYQGIVSKRSAWDADNAMWQLEMANNATGNVHVNTPVAGGAGWTGTGIIGIWRHVVATFDGAVLRMYIDGKQVPEAIADEVAVTIDVVPLEAEATLGNGVDAALMIGAALQVQDDTETVAPFNGAIDDVQLFNYAIDADQVKALYDTMTGL